MHNFFEMGLQENIDYQNFIKKSLKLIFLKIIKILQISNFFGIFFFK